MINIFNLNYKRDEKEIKKVETYRKILSKIHTKIKINSGKSLTHLVYIIPKYTPGLPAYDQIKCAEYCYERLKKNGFIVLYTYPNMVFISWDHVPSTLKNPDVKPLEHEFATNPYKDYSNIVYQISNINPKQSKLEYIAPSQNKYLLNGSNPDMTSNDFNNCAQSTSNYIYNKPAISYNSNQPTTNYKYNKPAISYNSNQPTTNYNYNKPSISYSSNNQTIDPYNNYPSIDNNHGHVRNKAMNFFSMLENSK